MATLGRTGRGTRPIGGMGKDMTDHPTDKELDAKLGKLAAETDTKIARMEGKLDLVLSKMDESLESSRATKANLWVIGTALAVLMVALALGVPAIFGSGLQLRDVVHNEVLETLRQVVPAPARTP